MKLPTRAINNAPFVLIVIILAIAVGIMSFIQMPRSEDPGLALPIYNMAIVLPGASPEDMEELVVDPIEEVVEDLNDIDEIITNIQEGLATLRIEGVYGVDADEQYNEVVREVNTVRPNLPDGIVLFELNQFKQEDRVVIQQYALGSPDASFARLVEIGEELEDLLKNVPGVKGLDLEAYPEEEVRVSLDFQRMAAQNISLNQVIGILQSNNANVPGGEVNSSNRIFSIKTTGGYDSLEEIESTVISSANGQFVYLRDIADISMDYEDERWIARYEGGRAILLSLKVERASNLLTVTENVDKIVAEYSAQLPTDITIDKAFDQAPAVRGRINDFFANLMQGILLVGVIIFIFLGWRASVIIMTVIPLCIIIALAMLNGIGYGMQQISIAALVIALGLLVDNGIVVIENINRFLKEGYSSREAAAKGTTEVGYAIISSTITTLLAFFPLTQLGEGAGEYLRSLPLTVMFALIISLALALTFSPLLASRMLRLRKNQKLPWAQRLLQSVVEKVYRPSLRFALKRSWLIIVLALVLLAGSVSLFPSIGVSFFPTADKPMLLIEVDTPTGSNLDATDKAVRFVESVLDTTDYVKDYSANVGHGNPYVYYNRFPISYEKNRGQLLVNFEDWDARRFYATLGQLRKDLAKYPAAKITFKELKNGAPSEAPIEIRIIGEQIDTLRRLANEVEMIMQSVPGMVNIDNPLGVDKTELQIKLNQEKAGMIGLSYLDFDRTVRASLTGIQLDEVSLENNEKYPLVLRMPFAEEPKISDFNKVYFTTQTGAQVPLQQVAQMSFGATSPEILHYSLDRYAVVTADASDADQTIPVTQEIINKLDEMEWPEGYRYYPAGEWEEQQTAFGSLGIILSLAMVAIFAVLVLQFRSMLQPLIVFSAIPLAITGSFVALWITGWSFSFFAFVGFISLIGIVVNNSIILVDYINQLVEEGMPVREAVQMGAERRFIPIVLTTITTILGLLPLTVQATSLWSPLGWTIIGGMISSTLLTLLVVPILYGWFTGSRQKAV